MQQTDNYQPYNGFLNVYKEAGYTSMDVCAKLRGILRMKKIGHAGTLDPMAEGVLPVALGRATKDVDRIGDGTKTYRAGMLLGISTDTQDITGQRTGGKEEALKKITEAEIRTACESFLGQYEQLTPMYSARKVNGKKLYEYARAGKEVERKTKQVEILSLQIESIVLPHVIFTVRCTKGTYIRTLCHDIGEKLGCGACMESLVRTEVGDFQIGTAVKLSEIEEARDRGAIDSLLTVKSPTAVALGKFDGTHRGHQKLFSELRKLGQERKLRTLVLILDIGKKMIESREDRRREIYGEGIDYIIELPLTEEMRHMHAEDFVRDILVKKFSMKAIVGGPDIGFGHHKRGNAELLYELSKEYGFEVKLIEKLRVTEENRSEAEELSSTLVREALKAGEMERVTELMGKTYAIPGRVVHGRHLGQSVLGFPTMNLIVDKRQELPRFGVYATRTTIFPEQGKAGRKELPLVYDGISNIGLKPTMDFRADYEPERVDLETNLFSYHGDAYGREIRVEFLHFIRPERKFGSIEEIREQLLKHDVEEAKKALAKIERS
ncbi:MAG: tRNA pseudouridine(55) synthase TruB [Eubacteriales bacterium]|nr:tRNA pseudouridine(55) synthase TruB [Eubacteriales bacterium]